MDIFIMKDGKLHLVIPSSIRYVQRGHNDATPTELKVGDEVAVKLLPPECGKLHTRIVSFSVVRGGIPVYMCAELEQTKEILAELVWYTVIPQGKLTSAVIRHTFKVIVPTANYVFQSRFQAPDHESIYTVISE